LSGQQTHPQHQQLGRFESIINSGSLGNPLTAAHYPTGLKQLPPPAAAGVTFLGSGSGGTFGPASTSSSGAALQQHQQQHYSALAGGF
jgi:hypothetical protein